MMMPISALKIQKNDMFQDCFGTQLREGDDVLVSLGRNHLHCGFVSGIFVIIDY